MKTSSHKTIPSIQRKPTRKFKPPSLPLLPSSIIVPEPHQLIFKAQILPIIIELQLNQPKQVTLNITTSHASIRSGSQTSSVPFNLGKAKWLRIILGHEIKKAELKSTQIDTKIDKNQLYKNMQQWKQTTKQQISNIHHFYFLPLLVLLKTKLQKRQKVPEVPSKNSIGSFIKTRLSERNNLRHHAIPFRNKYEGVVTLHNRHNQSQDNDVNTTFETMERKSNQTMHHQLRKGSNTLEHEKAVQNNHYPSHLKQSNTSTAISGQLDIKFNRRMKKFREKTDQNITQSQKHSMFSDNSQFFAHKKQKPKFYQHFNISQEEIDLKRKKFDSQFIYKKQTIPQTTKQIAPERNQSQVTQQICKIQNSSQLHPLEDTLQKGFIANNLQVDQSGTLYESVYE